MPLSPGTRLGPYEVTGALGAGGMGEVYRARDARLNRDVALKILPPAFADDTARMARFQREAQVLAALNHPNIAAIYGLEESALVMELVEGQTLAERIAQGAIPLDEALAIAHQIADALEAAHEKGIVHRDLKPANVKITPEGKVKVLDFGLAKAFDAAPAGSANSPTLTMEATRAGVILGTAGYMSPEQARGKPVDKRADIWSFGVVFYEMLTGRTTFVGETVSDTLAAILKSDPNWSRLPADTPFGVRRLLQRCLERDPKARLRDIGDAWIEMDRPMEIAIGRPRRQWLPWAIAALAVVGAVAWGWRHTQAPAPRTIVRSVMTLPNRSIWPALSRDGTRMVYTQYAGATKDLALRMMDQLEGRPIPGGENAITASFSPDGQWIVYTSAVAPHSLKKIPVTGGASIDLYSALAGQPDWGDDDTIVFTSEKGLMRIPAAGGKAQSLTTFDPKSGETGHYSPHFLPGSQAILFSVSEQPSGDASDSSRIALLDLKSGKYRVLLDSGHQARYVPTGHLVYLRQATLFAVPFDLGRLAVTGAETPVVELTDGGFYSFSDTSLLVYRAGSATINEPSTLEWMDRKGVAQSLAEPPHRWDRLSLSPDGKLLAASIRADDDSPFSPHADIWIFDLERHTLARMTFEGSNIGPVWSPDGRWVAYESRTSAKNGIYRVAVDKSRPPELLLSADTAIFPTSWTANQTLLYARFDGKVNAIWTLLDAAGDGEHKTQCFSRSSFTEEEARVSADGKWLAYVSSESGDKEIYLTPFPGPGGKSQVSVQGGDSPLWSRTGRELFYTHAATRELMAVDIPPGPVLRPGTPHALFKIAQNSAFDVAPDGSRFLVARMPERPTTDTFITVTNWFDDLLRRAPLKP